MNVSTLDTLTIDKTQKAPYMNTEKEPDGQTAAELPDPLDAQLTDLLRRADPEAKRAMIVLLQQMQKPD